MKYHTGRLLDHVHLRVADLAASKRFYRAVLEAVGRADAWNESEHHFDAARADGITCSAGVSSFPRDGATPREIIDAADKALYQAKRAGKNNVVTTEELIEEMA